MHRQCPCSQANSHIMLSALTWNFPSKIWWERPFISSKNIYLCWSLLQGWFPSDKGNSWQKEMNVARIYLIIFRWPDHYPPMFFWKGTLITFSGYKTHSHLIHAQLSKEISTRPDVWFPHLIDTTVWQVLLGQLMSRQGLQAVVSSNVLLLHSFLLTRLKELDPCNYCHTLLLKHQANFILKLLRLS